MPSTFKGILTIAALALALPVQAQDVDAAWKNLIIQGTYLSTDSHDNAKAEETFLKALTEAQRFGAADVRVGATYNRLGLIYRDEKKLTEAENAFRKALVIFEQVYGADSIDVANIDFNIASILVGSGKAAASMAFIKKSMDVYRAQFGDGGLKTADALCMMGDALRAQKIWAEAEEPLKKCADVREKDGGVLSPDFGEAQNSLAFVYQKEGKFALADGAFKLAEKIRERTKGITSLELAETLEGHAELLRQLGRAQEASRDEKMAESIRKLHRRDAKESKK